MPPSISFGYFLEYPIGLNHFSYHFFPPFISLFPFLFYLPSSFLFYNKLSRKPILSYIYTYIYMYSVATKQDFCSSFWFLIDCNCLLVEIIQFKLFYNILKLQSGLSLTLYFCSFFSLPFLFYSIFFGISFWFQNWFWKLCQHICLTQNI